MAKRFQFSSALKKSKILFGTSTKMVQITIYHLDLLRAQRQKKAFLEIDLLLLLHVFASSMAAMLQVHLIILRPIKIKGRDVSVAHVGQPKRHADLRSELLAVRSFSQIKPISAFGDVDVSSFLWWPYIFAGPQK